MLEELPTALRDAIADRYVLETQAGSGGMAFVYRARDVRHNRSVAVKVLRPRMSWHHFQRRPPAVAGMDRRQQLPGKPPARSTM